jgi:hypothetical protein
MSEGKGNPLATLAAVLVIAACMLMRACAKMASMG